jgi:serine/threonine-protein kinase
MSPEQMEGLSVDARADQFSAGAVFYELLSYKRAFPGELPSVVHKIMTGTREPLATLLPDADPSLIAIVDRCMAHVADDRYADMQAVRRDLAPVRQRVAADEQTHIRLRVAEARSVRTRPHGAARGTCGADGQPRQGVSDPRTKRARPGRADGRRTAR